MITCPKCGESLNVSGMSGVVACPQCGQQLDLGGSLEFPRNSRRSIKRVYSS